MTELKEECKIAHDKVYANTCFMTYPPIAPWICSKCGNTGEDRISEPYNLTYEQLLEKFNKVQ